MFIPKEDPLVFSLLSFPPLLLELSLVNCKLNYCLAFPPASILRNLCLKSREESSGCLRATETFSSWSIINTGLKPRLYLVCFTYICQIQSTLHHRRPSSHQEDSIRKNKLYHFSRERHLLRQLNQTK